MMMIRPECNLSYGNEIQVIGADRRIKYVYIDVNEEHK